MNTAKLIVQSVLLTACLLVMAFALLCGCSGSSFSMTETTTGGTTWQESATRSRVLTTGGNASTDTSSQSLVGSAALTTTGGQSDSSSQTQTGGLASINQGGAVSLVGTGGATVRQSDGSTGDTTDAGMCFCEHSKDCAPNVSACVRPDLRSDNCVRDAALCPDQSIPYFCWHC